MAAVHSVIWTVRVDPDTAIPYYATACGIPLRDEVVAQSDDPSAVTCSKCKAKMRRAAAK